MDRGIGEGETIGTFSDLKFFIYCNTVYKFDARIEEDYFCMFPMLQLEREEADFALPNFICNSGRAKFAVCHPGVGQWPMNWWTRSILQLHPSTENPLKP